MSAVIRVENLSKLYRLGEVGTGSLAHDVNRWWHRIRGKEDPYSQVGQVNDRTRKLPRKADNGKAEKLKNGDPTNPISNSQRLSISESQRVSASQNSSVSASQEVSASQHLSISASQSAPSDYVFALKDINFEVNQGEVLGIIGRNGAGKSTLLKILSRVTGPTSGEVKVKGRIAALLEVGTGFHPELTGRENVFLNGAVLGMSKAEIRSKLDQIVDFSGCEAYLNTPVKRYSSGMQVRLAFAVAAHLEPEILIVDEVLAVGDAEFQKKCIGRMSEVAGEGRTVLFVSHNLAAVRRLCTAGLIIRQGSTDGIQSMDGALAQYAMEAGRSERELDVSAQRRLSNWGSDVRIHRLTSHTQTPAYGEPWVFEMAIKSREIVNDAVLSYGFNSLEGSRVMTLDSDLTCAGLRLNSGWNEVTMTLPFNPLHPGPYSIGCSIWRGNLILDALPAAAVWEVHSGVSDRFSHRGFGACRPVVDVTTK